MPLGMLLDSEGATRLRTICQAYQEAFESRFRKLLAPVVDTFLPTAVQSYIKDIERLHVLLAAASDHLVQSRVTECELPDRSASVLRDVVISARLSAAERVEARRIHAVHPELQANLDEQLRPFDELIRQDWFQQATPKPAPQLADFFPVEYIEERLLVELGESYSRQYDEKFHILQAPSLFLRDLARARKAAALRGMSLAVAYLDIDKFKEINTEKGEPYVDLHVLPKFMRALESHVYARGYAYRYGGDEYCVLLNNVSEDEALDSMDKLRLLIENLEFKGTAWRTMVSVGVVIVRPDCHLSGREIEIAAAAAKAFAKLNGRNRVATYNTPRIQDKDLCVARPVVY